MTNPKLNPTPQQVKALQVWAREQGRTWKAALREAWMSGNYGHTTAATNQLQQVRNTLGPSWLTRYKLPVRGFRVTVLNPGEQVPRYASLWHHSSALPQTGDEWGTTVKGVSRRTPGPVVDSVYSVSDRSAIPMVQGGPVVAMLIECKSRNLGSTTTFYREGLPTVQAGPSPIDEAQSLPEVEPVTPPPSCPPAITVQIHEQSRPQGLYPSPDGQPIATASDSTPVEVIIRHTQFGEYSRLRDLGYRTAWVGDGKICLVRPQAPPAPLDEVELSKSESGRSAGEPVTLMQAGEPMTGYEYTPCVEAHEPGNCLSPMTPERFRTEADTFTKAYLEALLWASSAELGPCDKCGEQRAQTDSNGLHEQCGGEVSGTDASLTDRGFDVEECSASMLQSIVDDCKRFQEANGSLLTDENCLNPAHDGTGTEGRAGHDFYLTRHGHGAGFWDGDWEKVAGEALTRASKAFSETSPYVYRNADTGELEVTL